MQRITPPPKEELEDLMFNQMLSKKKLALHYGVCIRVIRRWMANYDLLNRTPIELQKLKRERTKMLKQKALEGESVVKIGFNSEFIEEYVIEAESEKLRRQENSHKRREIEKARRITKKVKVNEIQDN